MVFNMFLNGWRYKQSLDFKTEEASKRSIAPRNTKAAESWVDAAMPLGIANHVQRWTRKMVLSRRAPICFTEKHQYVIGKTMK